MKTGIGMPARAHVARSSICAFSVVGFVNGEVRVVIALCWKPFGIGGSPGPDRATAQASQMSAASSREVSCARS